MKAGGRPTKARGFQQTPAAVVSTPKKRNERRRLTTFLYSSPYTSTCHLRIGPGKGICKRYKPLEGLTRGAVYCVMTVAMMKVLTRPTFFPFFVVHMFFVWAPFFGERNILPSDNPIGRWMGAGRPFVVDMT